MRGLGILAVLSTAFLLAGCLGEGPAHQASERAGEVSLAPSALEAYARAVVKARAWAEDAYLAHFFGVDGLIRDIPTMDTPPHTLAYPTVTDGNLRDGRAMKWEFSFQRPGLDVRYMVAVHGQETWDDEKISAMPYRVPSWSIDSTVALRAAAEGSPVVAAALACTVGVWYTMDEDDDVGAVWSIAIHDRVSEGTQPVAYAWVDAWNGTFLETGQIVETEDVAEQFEGQLSRASPSERHNFVAHRFAHVNLWWESAAPLDRAVVELRDARGEEVQPISADEMPDGGWFYMFAVDSSGDHELTVRLADGSPGLPTGYEAHVDTLLPPRDVTPCWDDSAAGATP